MIRLADIMTESPKIYLNGDYLPLHEARISVLDRGFLFGDGVYEVIPVYGGQAFRLGAHLERLQHSLDGIKLTNPLSAEDWGSLVDELVMRNQAQLGNDLQIYLQVTRGQDQGRQHNFPLRPKPTVFAMAEALQLPPASQRAQGIAAITATDNRWLRCDIKTTSLMANSLLRQQAIEAGCAEAVLLKNGLLTEGAASSIFVVQRGQLLAPSPSHQLLPGITHEVILQLARQHGLPVQQRDISEAEVRSADELWLAASNKEVLPIVTLDDRPVGHGRPGPLYARMLVWYQDYKRSLMRPAR